MLIFEKFAALFTEEPLCPRFGVKCRKHRCTAYGQRTGFDANSGEKITTMGCGIQEFALATQIEATMASRSTAAAVESLRNETIKRLETGMAQIAVAITQGIQQLQIEDKSDEQSLPRHTDDSLLSSSEIHRDEGNRGGNGQSPDNDISESG